MSHIEHYTYMT